MISIQNRRWTSYLPKISAEKLNSCSFPLSLMFLLILPSPLEVSSTTCLACQPMHSFSEMAQRLPWLTKQFNLPVPRRVFHMLLHGKITLSCFFCRNIFSKMSFESPVLLRPKENSLMHSPCSSPREWKMVCCYPYITQELIALWGVISFFQGQRVDEEINYLLGSCWEFLEKYSSPNYNFSGLFSFSFSSCLNNK